MIRYSVDSTLTLRENPVFKAGSKGVGVYDRKNRSEYGFSLSNQAKRKIKQYISGYFLENNEKGKNISWVTLTVPPRMDGFLYQEWCDDKAIIRQLSRFLENLRKNHGLLNYVWIAERQDGKRNNYEHCTGAIHFHCIFDFQGFCSYPNLNLYWLKLLNDIGIKAFSEKALIDKINEGYFTIEQTYVRYKDTVFAQYAADSICWLEHASRIEKIALQELAQCWEALERQNFRDSLQDIDPMTLNPNHPFCKICYNPFEIEKMKMKDFNKLQTYLTKYVTKNESKIYGRAWASSRGFSSIDYSVNITQEQAAEIKSMQNMVISTHETKFEIGNNEFVSTSHKLDFDLFKKTAVYNYLVDSIWSQRKKQGGFDVFEFMEKRAVDRETYREFAFETMKEIVIAKNPQNSESRINQVILPRSYMPIDHDFDKHVLHPLPKPISIKQALIDFDHIEKTRTIFKS